MTRRANTVLLGVLTENARVATILVVVVVVRRQWYA
jgi:hypothetical protein